MMAEVELNLGLLYLITQVKHTQKVQKISTTFTEQKQTVNLGQSNTISRPDV